MIPLTVAEFVHLLYNVVDRVYLGHMEGIGRMALTGVGLAFPITTLVGAFTALLAYGGVPVFSIARGAGNTEKVRKTQWNVFSGLIILSLMLFAVCLIVRKPMLYAFGASDESYAYADAYLGIYLFGTTFAMVSAGMNGFINAQGYPEVGMATTMIGCILNLILDPLFIFALHMGVRGAALATVISQFVSFAWVMVFLLGKRNLYGFDKKYLIPDPTIMKEVLSVGIAGFFQKFTNFAVQIACNMTLNTFGGDLYVGVMTVLNSVRDLTLPPVTCVANGAGPVNGYNYGAKKYKRVKAGIRFVLATGVSYTILCWILIMVFPAAIISIFTNDADLISHGAAAIPIYFGGYVFMSFQFAGQATFTSLKCPKRAIFFSVFRKLVIVVPLTFILPRMGFGVNGVFMAEPISNVIGGIACLLTMYFTLYRKLPDEDM